MRPPLVSVVIPAWNVAPFIGEAIDSVLAQRYPNRELIVVNDGSPDAAQLDDVLARYADRREIRYLRQPNGGPSAARNLGIRHARGELIALLDGDDTWDPEYLSAQVDFLEQNPSLDVVYCDARLFGTGPLAGRTFMDGAPSSGDPTFERLIAMECAIPTTCVVARREAMVTAGLFDERFRRCEDYDLWLRMSAAGARFGYQRPRARFPPAPRHERGDGPRRDVREPGARLCVVVASGSDPITLPRPRSLAPTHARRPTSRSSGPSGTSPPGAIARPPTMWIERTRFTGRRSLPWRAWPSRGRRRWSGSSTLDSERSFRPALPGTTVARRPPLGPDRASVNSESFVAASYNRIMLIKPAADLTWRDVTDERLYLRRREFLRAAGVAAAAGALAGWPSRTPSPRHMARSCQT